VTGAGAAGSRDERRPAVAKAMAGRQVTAKRRERMGVMGLKSGGVV